MTDAIVPDHACCLETFANELRMRLLKELQAGPKNVTQLTAATKVERSRVSHALMELRKCNVVRTEKVGREVLYRLNEGTPLTTKAKGSLLQLIEQHAAANCKRCHKMR